MSDHLQRNRELPLDAVAIGDRFWQPYQQLVRDVVLPYQWEALNDRIADAEPSYCMSNLRRAAGLEEGQFRGMVFQDSDVAKWLEAVAYSLHTNPDPAMEAAAVEAIALLGAAQQPDGYLNSYFTTTAKGQRWTNLHECHELYVAGHLIEAGVAWHQATGRRDLLDIVCRIADNIDSTFGPEEGKLKGYDGHEEVELALARLYEATGEKRYLRLAQFFLDMRGTEPCYFTAEWEKRGKKSYWTGHTSPDPALSREYNQSHKPVRQHDTAVGHAVRQVYLLTGMADVAIKTGDEEMLNACRAVWRNIVDKQLYAIGGIGSTHHGEAFSFDYDLPNDTVYNETCASVGLIFFAWQMLKLENRREYADVIETALFNIIVGSMSKDGKHYFYVNPMDVWPEASEKNPGRKHVKAVRQKWFGCACCPPNLARLLASLGKYICTVAGDELIVHQYIGSDVQATVGGVSVKLSQQSDYPWDGRIRFTVGLAEAGEFALALRVPGWCHKATITVGGVSQPAVADEDGYVRVRRTWHDGDTVTLSLEMPVELIEANPLVRADAGKVTIRRGPVVFCLEEADCGGDLAAISLPSGAALTAKWDDSILGGVLTVQGTALRDDPWEGGLYRVARRSASPVPIKAVPYCLWGNRQPGEMIVWIRSC